MQEVVYTKQELGYLIGVLDLGVLGILDTGDGAELLV